MQELALLGGDRNSGSMQYPQRPEGACLPGLHARWNKVGDGRVNGINLWDVRTGVELLTWRPESKPGQPNKSPRHLGFDDESNALVLVAQGRVQIYPLPRPESLDSSTRWNLLLLVQAEKSVRWEEASTCLTRLFRARPGSQPLRRRQVQVLMALGRYSEAIAELRRGTELPPAADTPVAWWLAEEVRLAEEAELLPLVSAALEANPNSWSLRALRGWIRVRAGEVDLGADDLAVAVRQKGNRADLWGLLACSEVKRQRIGAADAVRKKMLRLFPRELPAWHDSEASRADLADEPLVAVWHLGHLIAGRPRSRETGSFLARRAHELGKLSRWKEAADDLAQAMDLLPGDNQALRCEYAKSLLGAGDLAGYRRACRALMRRWPADPQTGDEVAQTCLLAPDALPEMNPLIRLTEWYCRMTGLTSARGERFTRHPLIGAALLRARRFSSAIDYLSHPDLTANQSAQRLLVFAYRQQGRHREAETLELRLLDPSLAEQAAGLVGEGAGPFAGPGVLARLVLLESARQKVAPMGGLARAVSNERSGHGRGR